MASCAVCGAKCRRKCGRCGASLCATHRPSSTRATCAICKRQRTSAAPRTPGRVASPVRATPVSAPARSSRATRSLAHLPLTEQLAWIAERRKRLAQKQARERAYLDRRAARGTRTPTDEAYEADQVLETDLCEALDLLAGCLQGISAGKSGRGTGPTGPVGSSSTYAGDTSMLFPQPGPHDKLQP